MPELVNLLAGLDPAWSTTRPPDPEPPADDTHQMPPGKWDRPPICNLDELWDEVSEPFEPTMVAVEGGKPLLYAGCSHLVFGVGGSGKSMFCQHAVVEVLRAGGVVLYLDYENSARLLVDRLKLFGLEREHLARLGYWRCAEDLHPWMLHGLGDWLRAHPGTLVVLDGTARAIAASGFEEDNNTQVLLWNEMVIEPMTAAGITSLLIDHVVKPSNDRRSGDPASLYPRGAGAKIDMVSGAAYAFHATKEWTKWASGWAELRTAKDREGERKKGSVAARCEVTTGGQIRFRLYAPEPLSTTESGRVRYTVYMERVSRFIESCETPPARSAVEKNVTGGNNYIGCALDALREEGFISSPAGKPIVLARPYREADDSAVRSSGGDAANEPF